MIKSTFFCILLPIAFLYSNLIQAGGHSGGLTDEGNLHGLPVIPIRPDIPARPGIPIGTGFPPITEWPPLEIPKIDWPPPPIPGMGVTGYCGPNAICGTSNPASGIPLIDSCGLSGASCSSPLAARQIPPNSYPYAVALLRKNRMSCTGLLISHNQILTAAHCLCDKLPDRALIGASIYNDEASNLGAKKWVELSRETSFLQKNYCSARGQTPNPFLDLATIKTRRNLEISNRLIFDINRHIAPLPTNSTSVIVGFGASNLLNTGGVKRYAYIHARPCDQSNRTTTGCLPGKEAIAINRPKQDIDTCRGDSGGPLLFHSASGEIKLTAIISRKISQSLEKFCGSGGVYVLLNKPSVKQWLNNIIK